MTIKERLHRVVEELDEARATEVLAFALRATIHDSNVIDAAADASEPGVDIDAESLRRAAVPVALDDPLWSIVGMVDDDGPTDASSDKHRYLAESYGDLHDK